MFDVIAIGYPFVDYFFNFSKSDLKKYGLRDEDDFLFEDLKINPNKFFKNNKYISRSPGGNSLNTALILQKQKQELKVGFCGVIGIDTNGKFLRKNLETLDLSHTLNKGSTPICACLLNNIERKRAFLSSVDKSANDFINKKLLQYLNNSRYIFIGPLIYNPKKAMSNLSRILKNTTKPKVIFSPGIIHSRKGIKNIEYIIKRSYAVFLNSDELKALTNETNLKKAAKLILNKGPKIISCTLGEQGVYVATNNIEFVKKQVKPKRIIDTTGAGDAFAAGFILGLLSKKSLSDCAGLGNRIAAKSLIGYGLSWLI